MSHTYDYPEYYEIAFSFRDIPAEVNLFEQCFERFARIPVKSVLELACGNCPHLEELARRGYAFTGLDTNRAMLDYSRAKAARLTTPVNLICGDMNDFDLDLPVDFAYIMVGSLIVRDTAELHAHFDAVARALKPGGLYLLDWCIQYELELESEGSRWTLEADGIEVKTTVTWKSVNQVEQTFEETVLLEVNDHGKKLTVGEPYLRRAIYPQEFLCLIERLERFEFVGWWNLWDLQQPLAEADNISRPIALVRRV